MSQNLLPCPFCGEEDPALFLPTGTRHNWTIKCTKGCSVSIEGYATPEDAARAWNRRPKQPSALELVMNLPEVCDCGVEFPPNGKCDFCGARARYLTNIDW